MLYSEWYKIHCNTSLPNIHFLLRCPKTSPYYKRANYLSNKTSPLLLPVILRKPFKASLSKPNLLSNNPSSVIYKSFLRPHTQPTKANCFFVLTSAIRDQSPNMILFVLVLMLTLKNVRKDGLMIVSCSVYFFSYIFLPKLYQVKRILIWIDQ